MSAEQELPHCSYLASPWPQLLDYCPSLASYHQGPQMSMLKK